MRDSPDDGDNADNDGGGLPANDEPLGTGCNWNVRKLFAGGSACDDAACGKGVGAENGAVVNTGANGNFGAALIEAWPPNGKVPWEDAEGGVAVAVI